MAGTELEPPGVCAISLHHTKFHYALTLAKKGRETLWAAWRAVSSPQIAPHEVGSCMSGLLAPLYGASVLNPDCAAHFGELTLLKIQLAMRGPLRPRRGGCARLMKTVAGLQVLTSSGRNESTTAPCQLRTTLEQRAGSSSYLSPFILCRFLEGLPPGVDSLCERLVCRRSSTSTASTSNEPPRPTSLSLGFDLECLETPISTLCLTSRRARSAGGGGVAILPGV